MNALVLRPLPFRDPAQLVWISNIFEGGMSGETSTVGNYTDWRDQTQSFEDLAAYFAFFDYGGYNLTGVGEPERLRGVGLNNPRHHLIALICDNLDSAVAELRAKGAEFQGPIEDHEYGRVIALKVPGADDIRVYQPTQKLAYNL